jgi:hypothetical protein
MYEQWCLKRTNDKYKYMKIDYPQPVAADKVVGPSPKLLRTFREKPTKPS